MKYNVKITVMKREYYQDLADRFIVNPNTGKCSLFKEGDEFLVTPENYDYFAAEHKFCPGAWDILKTRVYTALQGGRFYWEGWHKNTKEQILCCDDGIRPVVFLLERIDIDDTL